MHAKNGTRWAGLMTAGAISIAALTAMRPPQQPASWALEAKPTVTIGTDDSDPAAILEAIVFATRLPDGSILVGDRGDFVLKIFAPNGTLRKSFARKGSGPGEVRFLATMFRCGAGRRLFREGTGGYDLTLRDTRSFDRGMVLLSYAPAKAHSAV